MSNKMVLLSSTAPSRRGKARNGDFRPSYTHVPDPWRRQGTKQTTVGPHPHRPQHKSKYDTRSHNAQRPWISFIGFPSRAVSVFFRECLRVINVDAHAVRCWMGNTTAKTTLHDVLGMHAGPGGCDEGLPRGWRNRHLPGLHSDG